MELPLNWGARHVVVIAIAVLVGGWWVATGKFEEGALLLGVITAGIAIQVILFYFYEGE